MIVRYKGVIVVFIGMGIAFTAGLLTGDSSVPEVEQCVDPVPSPVVQEREGDFLREKIAPASVPAVEGDSLFANLDSQDFQRLAERAAASSDVLQNQSMLRVLVGEWAMDDPEAALAYAARMNRDDLIRVGLLQMARSNGVAALGWLQSNVSDVARRRYLQLSVYQGMAGSNPKQALALAENIPQGPERDEALSIVVDEWSKQDIDSVFDWIKTAEITPQFSSIYTSVMMRYMDENPEAGAALLTAMLPCELKTTLAAQSARALADSDVTGALVWALGLDAGAQKNAVLNIIDVWSSGDQFPEALEYVLSNPKYEHYNELFEAAVINLSYNHEEDLMRAMETMKDADRLVATERLAVALSTTDFPQCDQWISSLPIGQQRDVALKNAFDTYCNSDVSQAYYLAETEENEQIRVDLIQRALTVWADVNPEAAEQALQNSTVLSEVQKSRLLEQIKGVTLTDYLLP